MHGRKKWSKRVEINSQGSRPSPSQPSGFHAGDLDGVSVLRRRQWRRMSRSCSRNPTCAARQRTTHGENVGDPAAQARSVGLDAHASVRN